MTVNAVRSGVASQIANYFSSNYEALLQSSAAQPVVPQLTLAPSAWIQSADNANKRFFLNGNGNITRLPSTATASEVAAAKTNAVEVDVNVAYNVESTHLSAVDWLMQRLADEFRLNQSTDSVGSYLTQSPDPELNVDLSSLDTNSLVRILNMLLGRARSAQKDTAITELKGNAASARALGLSAQNLSNAVELQAAFQGVASGSTTDSTSTVATTTQNAVASLLTSDATNNRSQLTAQAIDKLVSSKSSDLEGARLAYNQSAVGRLNEPRKLTKMVDIAARTLDNTLPGAADIALMQNPYLQAFGSELDLQQTNDGLLVRTKAGDTRELQQSFVKQALTGALQDPQLKQDLVDALASQADTLGLGNLSLSERNELLGEVADAVIAAALEDEAYLTELASQSVQFHADISSLIHNEVEAGRGREGTPQNV